MAFTMAYPHFKKMVSGPLGINIITFLNKVEVTLSCKGSKKILAPRYLGIT
jgi:hypothetical protein